MNRDGELSTGLKLFNDLSILEQDSKRLSKL